MTKGKATAVVSGRTIAETDEYETVEGNIYVRLIVRPYNARFANEHSFRPRMYNLKQTWYLTDGRLKFRQKGIFEQDGS